MSNDEFYNDSMDPDLEDFHPIDEDDDLLDDEDEIITKKPIDEDSEDEEIEDFEDEELSDFLQDEDY